MYLRLEIAHLSASLALLYCFKSLFLTDAFIVVTDDRVSLQEYYKTIIFKFVLFIIIIIVQINDVHSV